VRHDTYTCCTESEIENFLNVPEPRPEYQCIDDVERLCARQIDELQYAIDQEHVTFEWSAMEGCLRSLLAPSDGCSYIGDEAPWEVACKDVLDRTWVGQVPHDGECWIHEECADPQGYLRCARKPGPGLAPLPCWRSGQYPNGYPVQRQSPFLGSRGVGTVVR
jgi:hypothetical protein